MIVAADWLNAAVVTGERTRGDGKCCQTMSPEFSTGAPVTIDTPAPNTL
jgi:hypothetical protein